MIRTRLLPLLLAAALPLAAVGCGGDDEPNTTAASTPTTSASTSASTPTTTSEQPTTTTSEPSKDDKGEQPKPETTAQPAPDNPLANYTKGGKPADDQTANEVRTAMRDFLTAVSKGDGAKICSRIIGFDEVAKKLRQKDVTCESLMKNNVNAAAAPSKQALAAIGKAKVTVKGDRATLGGNIGPPLRKVDGVWKIDYGALIPAMPSASSLPK
ncbi:hypothetical protein [Patulibacter defluvii]|uniref:hypothetical protein n=1 Tax=Patulibacter defluvii TaxID=3095358 RepID=UPI002A758090|nr:hypothetical protein [Patulibacter sp. DM4]